MNFWTLFLWISVSNYNVPCRQINNFFSMRQTDIPAKQMEIIISKYEHTFSAISKLRSSRLGLKPLPRQSCSRPNFVIEKAPTHLEHQTFCLTGLILVTLEGLFEPTWWPSLFTSYHAKIPGEKIIDWLKINANQSANLIGNRNRHFN